MQNNVKKAEKWLKPWQMGTHMLVLNESLISNAYQHDRVYMIFKIFRALVPQTKVVSGLRGLTLPMLRLHSSKAQGHKYLWKPSKPCHVGIHWKALAEYLDEYPYARVSVIFQLFCIILPHLLLWLLIMSTVWHIEIFLNFEKKTFWDQNKTKQNL